MSGNVIGYARVSTRGQSLDSQVDALVTAGAVRVFQEYASGATQSRTRWKECLDYLQPGNVLTVTDLTRLGRSTADLADIVTVLGQRGIGFRSLAEPWLDTTSAHGKLIFDMFASLAEYERSRLSERTKAGLAAAKARGRLGGRPRTMTPSKTEAARQCESQSYLALNLQRLVADEKCFPCCVNDLRGECFNVVERLDPAHLCEESVDETEVSSSDSHDGCDGGCVGEVFLGIV
ncbi:DNA invertase Pin-like site-specific DNA recombinase [Arthrobacter sp. W4I7]|nr:DNA invertase Pin-like site-specific DNA recombinase [Arthrobacter sp. W4I7]